MRRVWVSIVALALAACGGSQSAVRVTQRFDATGVARIELRASQAEDARVVHDKRADIRVMGTTRGGAEGYHSSDPNWKETPASEWGMTFEAKRYGDRLVISSKNEIEHIHHLYYLDDLVIEAPEGVQIDLVPRELTNDGAPDLADR